MQSLLNIHSSYGLPLCLSGITHPLPNIIKEMADHDLRRAAMNKQKCQAREVFDADQEVGMQRNVERVVAEMRLGGVDEDLATILDIFHLPCSAKAA